MVQTNKNIPFAGNRLLNSILLVGDADAAFTDSHKLKDFNIIEQCPTMLDAINLTAQSHFEMICIIAVSFGPQVRSALKAIRLANPVAKIVLLVQMYEEPFAIEIINSKPSYADDYAICPMTVKQFRYEVLKQTEVSQTTKQETKTLTGLPSERDSETIEQLTRLATEDDLTGLKNRRYGREFLRQIIERAKEENMRLTLLVFDIDNFKHYNDEYGHAAGDDILRQAAILMRNCCRKHDVVARMGGDEFAVIFWDAPDDSEDEAGRRSTQAQHPHEILFIAERFGRELTAAHLPSLGPEGKGVLTISGGLAGFPQDGSNVEELFEQADKALLEAKRSGKNRIYLVGEPAKNEQD